MNSGRWKKGCKARCADSGKACGLLEGHILPHRHGRTAFVRAAAPGQTEFRQRDELEAASFGRPESPFGERRTAGYRDADLVEQARERYRAKQRAKNAAVAAPASEAQP